MPEARPSTISPVGEGSATGRAATAPSTPLAAPSNQGSFLNIVTPEALTSFEKAKAEEQAQSRLAREEAKRQLDAAETSSLAAYIRGRYHYFRTERQTRGTEHALLRSLRVFRGQYDPTTLSEIQAFGGSTVYSRMTAGKCRGASSLLREVYLGGERPWAIDPTPKPEIPVDLSIAADDLLASEAAELAALGELVPNDVLAARQRDLHLQVEKRVRQIAEQAAVDASTKIEDMLIEGGYYEALKQFLQDLPIFPFAVLKGPVVRQVTDVKWSQTGEPEVRRVPKMHWTRVSPFDFFWSPGSSNVERAEVIERWKVSRAELNACRGVPGYFTQAINDALDAYGRGGLSDWLNESDTERAWIERKEDPHQNRSGLIDAIEYHGPVQGRQLVDGGVPLDKFLPPGEPFQPLQDYMVQVILVGAYVIKVTANPDPLKRHPYYVTSYEKVPGAIPGHGLPEILASEESVANATLRALVNNLSLASGPQVVVNTERLDPSEDSDELRPWKRWHVLSDPLGRNADRAIDFFQPQSNAQELLSVYGAVMNMADENSALPRYQTGGSKASGAARTASGLAQLTQASNRVMLQVASNIDSDVMGPSLKRLYDMIMLTDRDGLLRGDETIAVRGATRMAQQETERMRQLELLQMTTNPTDLEIIGMEGRAELLREISQGVGLSGPDIVPSRDELKIRMAQQQAEQAAQPPMPPAATGAQPPAPGPGADRIGAETDNMHRVNA